MIKRSVVAVLGSSAVQAKAVTGTVSKANTTPVQAYFCNMRGLNLSLKLKIYLAGSNAIIVRERRKNQRETESNWQVGG